MVNKKGVPISTTISKAQEEMVEALVKKNRNQGGRTHPPGIPYRPHLTEKVEEPRELVRSPTREDMDELGDVIFGRKDYASANKDNILLFPKYKTKEEYKSKEKEEYESM